MKLNKRVSLTLSDWFTNRKPEMAENGHLCQTGHCSYLSAIQSKTNENICEVGYVFLKLFQLDRAISLAKLLSTDACVANVSLAPVQLVKNGCFPLVLNLLPDRIDWNGNPPSWPRLVHKNSSFFTARSNSPSSHFPGNKEEFCGFVFSKTYRLNQREIFSVTFGWSIVKSTTFRLQFSHCN